MDNVNPYRSPTTAPTSGVTHVNPRRWRIGGFGLLMLVGCCFLLLLNGQVFANNLVFLGLAATSLLLWIPLVARRSRDQDRRFALYVILAHVVVILVVAMGLMDNHRQQRDFNIMRERLRDSLETPR